MVEPEEFVRLIGEFAMGFAWLEDTVSELLHTLIGTPKATVFTDGLGFELKLQKIEALLRMEPIPCASDIKTFIGQCRLTAEGRNNALHARHLMSMAGGWQRLKKDKVTDVSTTELRRLCDLVVELCSAAIMFSSIVKAERAANAHPG